MTISYYNCSCKDIIFFFFVGRIDNPDKLSPNMMAQVAFKEMDFNHDNSISKDEFLHACLGSDTISATLAYKLLDICTMDCA